MKLKTKKMYVLVISNIRISKQRLLSVHRYKSETMPQEEFI